MAKKILIPLDGSKIGESALHYVEEMISNLSVEGEIEVVLLHVLPMPIQRIEILQNVGVAVPMKDDEISEMKQKALDYLKNSSTLLRSIGVHVNHEVLVRETSASSANEIIKAEGDFGIDLVAMSTHGRRGINRWAFGSVTEKVLRGGNVPVLVVRAK